MENVLIVSYSEKGVAAISELLHAISCNNIVIVHSCGEARRKLLERDFDLILINSPLKDESGENLSREIAAKGASQVIFIVDSGRYDDISAAVEDYGVITIAKPINKHIFWTALKLAKASQNRLRSMQVENNKLVQRIEDIRIVNRAKYILISYLKMNEEEAHKYIEKQAMDMRITRREVAEGILKTYEN